MNRSEATDLLYLIRRLWHRTTEVTVDDVTAAMLVLGEVEFQAAVAAVTRLGSDGNDFPPPLPAIAGEVTRKPPPALPYHAPYVELDEPHTATDAVLDYLAEARATLRRIEGGAA